MITMAMTTRYIFYSLYLAPKVKYCLTIINMELVQEHKTFKGFGDVKTDY